MPAIIASHDTDNSSCFANVYAIPPEISATNPGKTIPIPPGIGVVRQRVSFAEIVWDAHSRLLICGGFTDNLLVDEELRVLRQGLTAPDVEPTIAASGTGITGAAIGYFSFWDDIGKRGSPLSVGSDVLNLVNQGRQWTNIPTVPSDELFYEGARTNANATTTINATTGTIGTIQVGDRVALSTAPTTFATVTAVTSTTQFTVTANLGNGTADQLILVYRHVCITHVKLWVSMNGATPRLAATVDLGVSTFTENVATLALGEAAPDEYTRFPPCRYNFVWQQRQWMCGDPTYPNRIYYSPVNVPDLMEGWLETRYGDAAIGLFGTRDMMFVGSSERIYRVNAYTADDFELKTQEPGIGIVSHFGCIPIHNNILVASRNGLYLCTGGSFIFIAGEYQDTWRALYGEDADVLPELWAHDHKDDGVVRIALEFGTVACSSGDSLDVLQYPSFARWVNADADLGNLNISTVYLCVDYSDMDQRDGSGLEVFLDIRARDDISAFYVPVVGSVNRGLWVVSDDGKIRLDNSSGLGDTGDDSDVLKKLLLISPGHYFGENFGGDEENDGRSWKHFWAFMESETSAWDIQLVAGDEKAYLGDAQRTEAVAASADSDITYDEAMIWEYTHTYVPVTTHFIGVLDKVAGRGLTHTIGAISPAHNISYRGWGAVYGPGRQERGAHVTTAPIED